MADFKLRVYTQEKMEFEGEVTSLIAPGEEGYLGILAHHAPLLSTLGEGEVTIRKGTTVTEYRISGGFLEVHGNQATVLADKLISNNS